MPSRDEIDKKILERCRCLYETAQSRGDIRKFEGSPYEFILCDSGEFCQALVNMRGGNPALGVTNLLTGESFFLLFRDKMPEEFYPMEVIHASAEHARARRTGCPVDAHIYAAKKEIENAERLGKREDYLKFIEENYPKKYASLIGLEII